MTHVQDVSDEDELFEQLEKECELGVKAWREERVEQLKRNLRTVNDMRADQYGTLMEYNIEKELVKMIAAAQGCVVHCYHTDFRRCCILDEHLRVLAAKYFYTRFVRVGVSDVPFLVSKMQIRVLPCLLVFIDGVIKARYDGFEKYGDRDDFETSELENVLLKSGVIK